MELPHLVRDELGGEAVEATVNLGDEDLVCVTPTRTLIYRGEGLLSDESIETFDHDVERLDVSAGRRKTKFVLEYVDGKRSFTVPSSRADAVLDLLLSGILQVAGVITEGESVSGVFTFSELTLVVTGARLVKHVGTPIWDDDHEVFPYERVTGLEFEEGSVATQVVLSVDGRPQRIKAPSDDAPKVRQALTGALFAYHGVDSLAELNETVRPEPDDADTGSSQSGEFDLTDDISPLVGGESAQSGADGDSGSEGHASGAVESPSPATEPATETVDTVSTEPSSSTASVPEPTDDGSVDAAEFEAVQEQLAELTRVVEEQNELLSTQQETIQQLIEELRRGR